MNFGDKLFYTAKSLVKTIVQSRRCTVSKIAGADRIIIMGNGPSLNDTIAAHADLLRTVPTMAVNFAANAPVFGELKPRFYVLADPYFFSDATDSNLLRLWDTLAAVDWPMTLYVPVPMLAKARKRLGGAAVKAEGFNAVGAEGFDAVSHFLYRRGLAMPRPRNVLIPAIMLAIQAGFRQIDIVGADHSWMKTLSVTDDNEVVSVQEHFYADSKEETTRVRHEYRGYALYQIVESFAVAFRSYTRIRRYADTLGISIHNCTPSSFIDAFPRRPLR